MLGFGWAGIFRKYLVEPAAMWWPANLVQVSLFRYGIFLIFFSNLVLALPLNVFQFLTLYDPLLFSSYLKQNYILKTIFFLVLI